MVGLADAGLDAVGWVLAVVALFGVRGMVWCPEDEDEDEDEDEF
jgi:hypothetical protein